MELDFRQENILIRPGTDKWGPYSFDFSNALPPGTIISNVTATAYMKTGSDTWSEKPELIEPGTISITGNTTIQLKLQGTGTSGPLATGWYFLQIVLTLDSGAVHPFIFGVIKVESF